MAFDSVADADVVDLADLWYLNELHSVLTLIIEMQLVRISYQYVFHVVVVVQKRQWLFCSSAGLKTMHERNKCEKERW